MPEESWFERLIRETARKAQDASITALKDLPEGVKKPLRRGVGRVLTNVIEPYGYESEAVQSGGASKLQQAAALFSPKELPRTLRKIWEDTSAVRPSGEIEGIEEADLRARRPLFREYFDLNPQDVDKVFDRDGKSYRINPETENKLAQFVLHQFRNPPERPAHAIPGEPLPGEARTNMLSRFYTPGQPDPWNFDVPAEQLAQYEGRPLPLQFYGRELLEAIGRPAVLETGGYQSGGIVSPFGGQNMNGITMQTQPARRRIGRGDMAKSGIGMGRPRNTFPVPSGRPADSITMRPPGPPMLRPPLPPSDFGPFSPPGGGFSTAPAYAPAPGPTDTVPAWLTPGEGVLNRGAMSMIGEGPVNALNRYGRGISGALGYAEGGVAKEDEDMKKVAGTAAESAQRRQLSPDEVLPWWALHPDFMKYIRSHKSQMASIIPGFQEGTGRVGRNREIGSGEFVRTDYGPGMPSLGRSPADLNEFTGSYDNPLGPNDVAVHPNNPFGLKPGPGVWSKFGDEWKHIADYLNRRLDPRKIDFYHPKQPIQQGGFGGRRGPVFGSGGLHQGGGPVSEGGGTGGGGWGGGGDWGAGGIPGGGAPPPGQVSISNPSMSGPEVMEWAPGFNAGFGWKPWKDVGNLPARTGQGMAEGGVVPPHGISPEAGNAITALIAGFTRGSGSGYAAGTSGVEPIGYTDPIEEAEWQKVIPMLPPNVDVAKLKQSGIDPQAALKLFGSVYGGFQGAGTSPTGYNDLAAGGGA